MRLLLMAVLLLTGCHLRIVVERTGPVAKCSCTNAPPQPQQEKK